MTAALLKSWRRIMEENKVKYWWQTQLRIKEDRAVVKLRGEDKQFHKSIIIPTSYYPLNGKAEIFTYENTEQVKDEKVIEIFDKTKHWIGHCYTDSINLAKNLKECGHPAKTYVGWLFTQEVEPIHHAWVMLGNSVLDLTDDYKVMFWGENGKNFEKAKTEQEYRELVVSFAAAAAKWKNSQRCGPIGQPTPFLLYIGSECDPDEGRAIYNDLMAKYPDHECEESCDENGVNPTQRLMIQHGLI